MLGFDPYSLRFSNGPGSIAANNGVPQNLQTAYSDLSRAGQWYNGQGYVGVSSPTYGTLTAFRQNTLTLDASSITIRSVPPTASRRSASGNHLRRRQYRKLQTLDVAEVLDQSLDHFRAAAVWQFGGYCEENNASNGAYQFQLGADIPIRGSDVLSVDAIYSHVKDSGIAPRWRREPHANDVFGSPLAPFLPQTLTATISDNTAAMFVARYTTKSLKLYAGYEYIRYEAPQQSAGRFHGHRGKLPLPGLQCPSTTRTSITRRSAWVVLATGPFRSWWADANTVHRRSRRIGAHLSYTRIFLRHGQPEAPLSAPLANTAMRRRLTQFRCG